MTGRTHPLSLPMIATGILTLSLFVIRFGYDVGVSDQDEWLPSVIASVDKSSPLHSDWLVSSQTTGLSVRSAIIGTTAFLATAIKASLVDNGLTEYLLSVGILHGLSWLLLLTGAWIVIKHFATDNLVACAAVVLVFVLTPQWTLGGNDFAHSSFAPSMLAWGFGLIGVGHMLRMRFVVAYALSAIAFWFQPLVGLQLAVLILAFSFWHSREERSYRSAAIVGALLFVVASLPLLLALAGGELSLAETHRILAVTRAPHHYDIFSFPLASIVKFTALLIAGLTTSRYLLQEVRTDWHVVVMVCLTGIVIAVTSSVLGEEGFFIGRLQLFKYSLLLKLFSLIAIANAVGTKFFEKDRSRLKLLIFGAGAALASALVLPYTSSSFENRINRIGNHLESDERQMHKWIASNAEANALLLTPPGDDRVRTFAQRPIVVNFKAVAFNNLAAWQDRITSICDLPDTTAESLNQCYNMLTDDELEALATRWSATHIIRADDCSVNHPRLEAIHEQGNLCAYKVVHAE